MSSDGFVSEINKINKINKIHIVESDGCDYCNNLVGEAPVLVLCNDCREYFNRKMRRRILVDKLIEIGLKFREDSILAKKYIRGDEDTTADDVVKNLLEMHFFIKYTDYRNLVKELVSYYHIEKYGGTGGADGAGGSSKIENKEDINEIKSKAKTIALDKYVRSCKDLDNVPPSLKNVAEIVALETYIDI